MNVNRRPGRVEGQVALITGAARGQGRSHAIRLAQEGCDIIAVDLCAPVPDTPHHGASPADLAMTVAAVEAEGRRIRAATVDVRDRAALQAVVDESAVVLGRLDIVVANAGVAQAAESTISTRESVWRDLIDINLTGAWNTASVAVPHLIAGERGGAVVFTSSAAGLRGFPNVSGYVAAKHGLTGLMRSMAVELAPHSIRVNTVNPTNVGTDMIMNNAHRRLFCPGVDDPSDEEFRAACQRMNALPVPWVESIDVSNAVLFLVSDEARYVTGVTLPVDAGVLL